MYISYRSSFKEQNEQDTLVIHAGYKCPGIFIVRNNFQHVNISTRNYEEILPRNLEQNTNTASFSYSRSRESYNLLNLLFMNGFPHEVIRFKKKKPTCY